MKECLKDGLPNGFEVMMDHYAQTPRPFDLMYFWTIIAKGVEFEDSTGADFPITYYAASQFAFSRTPAAPFLGGMGLQYTSQGGGALTPPPSQLPLLGGVG